MSKIGKLTDILDGRGYVSQTGLHAYHTAAAVRKALLTRCERARLARVRDALVQYRVQAWNVDGRVELRDGAEILGRF